MENELIRNLLSSFREVNSAFYKQSWQHAKDLGITVVQLQILRTLNLNPGLSLQQLTEYLHTGKSTVSSTVDRLVKAGFILRESSEKDRRAIVLSLTELGREKEAEGHANFYKRVKGLNEIDPESISELLHIHSLIVKKLNDIGDDSPCEIDQHL